MRDSGFDVILEDLLKSDVVYAGWSAGSCVAGDRMDVVGSWTNLPQRRLATQSSRTVNLIIQKRLAQAMLSAGRETTASNMWRSGTAR